MNRSSFWAATLTVVAAIFPLLSGCESRIAGTTDGVDGKPQASASGTIVTTCGMVTDIVRVVADGKHTVVGLMGEGVDPHMYKPTRNDISQLLSADIVFYSGLMLEGRMGDTFVKVAGQGKLVYPVTQRIDEKYLREPPEFEGHWDPHVWMDVMAWRQCVDVVADALSKFDPPHADFYRKNAEAYGEELNGLDEYVLKVIASIPENQKVLITAHDAFGYFSRAYGIEVLSVQGLSTETGAGVHRINELVSLIVERKIGGIFVESSVNPKNIEALIAGAADRGWKVRKGGELFSDAMGKPGTYEGTYIGMMDHNATTIARALGGEAPERGLNGKLAAVTKSD